LDKFRPPDLITYCKSTIGSQNYAILTTLTSDFDFLLQLGPSFISNLAICFKIILELQISFNLSQIKSSQAFFLIFSSTQTSIKPQKKS